MLAAKQWVIVAPLAAWQALQALEAAAASSGAACSEVVRMGLKPQP